MRFASFAAFVLISTCSGAATTPADAAEECKGIWSSIGQQPHVGDAYTADAIASPNKEYAVTVSEDGVRFTKGASQEFKLDVPVNTALMEIVWSPDSKNFAVNVSDGNNDGPWRTFIYGEVAAREQPALLTLDSEIQRALSALQRCDTKAPANLAAVAWAEGGREAIVVAETPTLGSCGKRQGELAGFRVSMRTGKILERLTRASLSARWSKERGCRARRV